MKVVVLQVLAFNTARQVGDCPPTNSVHHRLSHWLLLQSRVRNQLHTFCATIYYFLPLRNRPSDATIRSITVKRKPSHHRRGTRTIGGDGRPSNFGEEAYKETFRPPRDSDVCNHQCAKVLRLFQQMSCSEHHRSDCNLHPEHLSSKSPSVRVEIVPALFSNEHLPRPIPHPLRSFFLRQAACIL